MAVIYGTNISDWIDDATKGVTEGKDIIIAMDGGDTIFGLGGDDLIKGGGGADNLYGGQGVDTADYSDSNAGVIVDLDLGTGLGGTAEGDKLYSIENVNGSSYDDTLIGDAGDNVLDGGAGNDQLFGNGGADTLVGGAGDDFLVIDGVGDKVDGGTGIDTIGFNSPQIGV